MSHDEVGAEVVVGVPAGDVWRALVDGERRRQLWSYLEIAAVVGGGFTERWVDDDGREVRTVGTVTHVVPDQHLRMTWADERWPAETTVDIVLTPVQDGTKVRVRHEGWRRLPDGGRLAQEHAAGWRLHLADLQAFLEGTN